MKILASVLALSLAIVASIPILRGKKVQAAETVKVLNETAEMRTVQDISAQWREVRHAEETATFSLYKEKFFFDRLNEKKRLDPVSGSLEPATTEAIKKLIDFYRYIYGADKLRSAPMNPESMQAAALMLSKRENAPQSAFFSDYSWEIPNLSLRFRRLLNKSDPSYDNLTSLVRLENEDNPFHALSFLLNEGLKFENGEYALSSVKNQAALLADRSDLLSVANAAGVSILRFSTHGKNFLQESGTEEELAKAWPSAGYFPLQALSANRSAWHLTLNKNLVEEPVISDLKVSIVELDKKSKSALNICNYDYANSGLNYDRDRGILMFLPHPAQFAQNLAGKSFAVKVSGLREKNGQALKIMWSFSVFDAEADESEIEETSGKSAITGSFFLREQGDKIFNPASIRSAADKSESKDQDAEADGKDLDKKAKKEAVEEKKLDVVRKAKANADNADAQDDEESAAASEDTAYVKVNADASAKGDDTSDAADADDASDDRADSAPAGGGYEGEIENIPMAEEDNYPQSNANKEEYVDTDYFDNDVTATSAALDEYEKAERAKKFEEEQEADGRKYVLKAEVLPGSRFYLNSKFEKDSFKVERHYKDGSVEPVYAFEVTGYDTAECSWQEITVRDAFCSTTLKCEIEPKISYRFFSQQNKRESYIYSKDDPDDEDDDSDKKARDLKASYSGMTVVAKNKGAQLKGYSIKIRKISTTGVLKKKLSDKYGSLPDITSFYRVVVKKDGEEVDDLPTSFDASISLGSLLKGDLDQYKIVGVKLGREELGEESVVELSSNVDISGSSKTLNFKLKNPGIYGMLATADNKGSGSSSSDSESADKTDKDKADKDKSDTEKTSAESKQTEEKDKDEEGDLGVDKAQGGVYSDEEDKNETSDTTESTTASTTEATTVQTTEATTEPTTENTTEETTTKKTEETTTKKTTPKFDEDIDSGESKLPVMMGIMALISGGLLLVLRRRF